MATRLLYELYTLTNEKKAQIDILIEQGLSMRKTAEILGISHSTISRYKANIYKKRHRKKTSMMNHTKWNIDHKTVLPISLRPKCIKKNEYDSMISIIDRCSKKFG